MGDPADHSTHQPPELLQLGPSRSPLWQKIPARWRRHAVAFFAFVAGVAVGGGAILWWQASPATSPSGERADKQSQSFDEHAVELILLEAASSRKYPNNSESEAGPLHVDSAVVLSGVVTSTVLTINDSDNGLVVRAPALPVTVSSTTRYQLIDLEITVQDCESATRSTPVDRPFTITWRDEQGMEHLDSAGDFDRSMATSLTRYIDAACDDATHGSTNRLAPSNPLSSDGPSVPALGSWSGLFPITLPLTVS